MDPNPNMPQNADLFNFLVVWCDMHQEKSLISLKGYVALGRPVSSALKFCGPTGGAVTHTTRGDPGGWVTWRVDSLCHTSLVGSWRMPL